MPRFFGRQRYVNYTLPEAVVLIQEMDAWYDAKDISTGDEQTLANRNNGAQSLTRGSTGSSDANDPRFLPYTDADGIYAHFWDINDNHIYSDAFATPSASSFVIEVDFALTDVTAAAQGLACQYITGGGGNRAWGLRANSGVMNMYLSDDGSANDVLTSNASLNGVGISNGQRIRIKCTVGLNVGGATADYEYSTDGGSNYTALGTQVTDVSATYTQIYQASIRMIVGARYGTQTGGGTSFETPDGKIYGVWIDGVKQFDPSVIDTTSDPDAGQTSWTQSSPARTWTVSRGGDAYQTTIVTRPVMVFDGVDDYLQLVSGNDPTFTKSSGDFTGVIAMRYWTTPSGSKRMFSWESGASDGLYSHLTSGNAPAIICGDGSSTAARTHATALTSGRLSVAAITVEDGVGRIYQDEAGFDATTADIAGLAGTVTHGTGRYGSRGYTVQNEFTGEVFFLAVDDAKAFNEDEIDLISQKIRAGTYT